MSENTNKIFWISALGIIVTAVCLLIFWSVGKPTKNIYDNSNNTSLCTASSRSKSLLCLDASNNSAEGNHTNNEGENKEKWYSQANIEKKDNKYASLTNFNYNNKSGWLDYALLFDGNDDKVSLNLGGANFEDGATIQVNVKPKDTTNTPIISNGNISISVRDGHFVFKVKTPDEHEVVSEKTIVAGDWYLVQATYNNDRIKIYINGLFEKSEEISGKIATTSTDFTLSPGVEAEISSIMIYNKDIELTGINQNAEAIYRKVYSIDAYMENFLPVAEGCKKWTVPMTGEYQVELWGAQGASVAGGTGGKGAYTSGELVLTKGDSYYVCVGNQGTATSNLANGGEATDFRLNYDGNKSDFNSLKSRLMIAAGGGGGNNALGGPGGTLNGLTSKTNIENVKNPKGGTQISGGERAIKYTSAVGNAADVYVNSNNGKFAYGGTASTGATGGDGYYGGGSISYQGGAGGGSSYISGHNEVDSLLSSSTEGSILHSGSTKHYSGVTFFSTKMINGTGNMPSSEHIDKSSYGQTGNGHARITYISSNQEGFESSGEAVKPGKPVIINHHESDTSITANYKTAENAQGYACYYGTDKDHLDKIGMVITTLAGDKQCNIYGLEQNTDYFIRMDAINGDLRTESDITLVHTEYTKPSIPILNDAEVTTESFTSNWNPSTPATSYTCALGTTMDKLNLKGTVSINEDGTIQCVRNNLVENTRYYFTLTAINGDKETESELYDIKTPYKTPEKPVLTSSESSYDSITARYSKPANATAYHCSYGLAEDALENEGEISINSDGSPICFATDLTEGTDYFFQLSALNGTEVVDSDINKIKTEYKEPDRPIEVNNTVTNSSITSNFNNLGGAKSFQCYYGEDAESVDIRGVELVLPSGEVQCNFSGLSQNKQYFYKLVAINGPKKTESDVYNARTDYNDAIKPTYKESTVSGLTITSKWNISGQEEEYRCLLSSDGTNDIMLGDGSIEGNVITCTFNNLSSDTDYWTRVEAVNGSKTAAADYHKDTIGLILPNISYSVDNSIFNENGYAKANFDVNLHVTSGDVGSILGVAYCAGTSKCTPNFDLVDQEGGDEESGTYRTQVLQANDSSTTVITKSGVEIDKAITISTESNTNYICATAITRAGKRTSTICSDAYKLDKTPPTVTYTDTMTATEGTSLGMYTNMTMSDNLTAESSLIKSYNPTPNWNTPGTYTINYSIKDLAGNAKNFTRTLIIKPKVYTPASLRKYDPGDGTVSTNFDSHTGVYTITQNGGSSGWGQGVICDNSTTPIYWGQTYALEFEIYTPTTRTLMLDCNVMFVDDGSGNDLYGTNYFIIDGQRQTSTSVNITAGEWHTIQLLLVNDNPSQNPSHKAVKSYSGFGFRLTGLGTLTYKMQGLHSYVY